MEKTKAEKALDQTRTKNKKKKFELPGVLLYISGCQGSGFELVLVGVF